MTAWQTAGQQRYRTVGDIIEWEAHGQVTRDELAHIFQQGVAMEGVYGYALFLILARSDMGLSPEVRSYLAEFHRKHKAVGTTAICGMNPVFTVVVGLVLRAIHMVTGKQVPTRFFRSEDDARLWLGEERTLLRKGQHPTQAPAAAVAR